MKKMLSFLVVAWCLAVGVQAADFSPNTQTTDATATDLYVGTSIAEDALCKLPIYVFATDHAGNVSLWNFNVAIRRIDNGTPTTVFTLATRQNSAGAALWSATIVTANGGAVYARVTGGVLTTIDWRAISDDIFCMTGPII